MYVASSDLLKYINYEGASSDNVTFYESVATRAEKIIDTYCGRTFEADSDNGGVGSSNSPVTRYFDAIRDIENVSLLVDKDLCLITGITNGDGETIASTDYVTEPRNETPYHEIRLLGSTGAQWTYATDPENAIAIAGVWAFSTTAPADIAHATLRLTNWILKGRNANFDVDRPVQTDSGFIIQPSQIPADIQTILQPYRRMRVGY
jgi:hypothetical protein